MVVGLRESVAKLRAIHVAEETLLGPAGRTNCDVHLGRHTAQNAEVGIDVRFDGRISEIDLREMAILFLRQIERELVVDGEVIVARLLARIAVIVIG